MKTLTALLLAALAAGALITTLPALAMRIPDNTVEYVRDPLTHPQRVWEYALEWCESNGEVDAINPKDSDGTPSYYSWEFKPETFREFGTAYKVLPADITGDALMRALHTYATEQKVLDAMILHRDDIKWSHQFPACVKKLGYPPASIDKELQVH